jgi:hypothetical protein
MIVHGGARDAEIMARESAKRPAIRSGLSDQHSVEAKEMGRHLGRHLVSMRGSGFYDLFTKGIVEAGQQSENTAKQTGMPNPNATSAPPTSSEPPTSEPPTSEPPTEQKGSGALFYRKGDMAKDTKQHHEEHTARRFGMVRKGGALKKFDFSKLPKKEHDTVEPAVIRNKSPFDESILQRAIEKDKKLRELGRSRRSPFGPSDVTTKGGYLSGPYEGMGEEECGQTRSKGKGRRAPAGPNDGRRKRAEIVKKVMAEKGIKMIEASKYVKEHNLY